MLQIIGTIRNTLKLAEMDNQWYQKQKELEKTKQKRRADMDPMAQEILRYKDDLEKMRESNQMSSIDTKLKSGAELTPEEIAYLKKNAPESYREYEEVKREKEAYEHQLKSCRTKEDVEKLKLNKMGQFMAEAKSISNNPNIPKNKKLGLMAKLLKKSMGIQKVHAEFTRSVQYQELPTEEEVKERFKVKADLKKEVQTKSAQKQDGSSEVEPAEDITEEAASATDEQQLEAENPSDVHEAAFTEVEPAEHSAAASTATLEEVKSFLTDYLTANRSNGYGLEYLSDMDETEQSKHI